MPVCLAALLVCLLPLPASAAPIGALAGPFVVQVLVQQRRAPDSADKPASRRTEPALVAAPAQPETAAQPGEGQAPDAQPAGLRRRNQAQRF